MIARSAVTRLSYSLRTVISCATIASYFACASLVSVIVATPTSKLRFACASCSDDRLLLALGELDVELGEQNVEVRDGDADDQVLLRGAQDVVRLRDLLLRLVVQDQVLVAEHRLRRRHDRGVLMKIAVDVLTADRP